MTAIALVHQAETYSVSYVDLLVKCHLFQELARTNPSILTVAYHVASSVSPTVFKQFIAAIENKRIEITTCNFPGLSALCEEFGFNGLSNQLSEFRRLAEKERQAMADVDARERISKLEEAFERQQDESAVRELQVRKQADLIAAAECKLESQSRILEAFEKRLSELENARFTNMEIWLSEVTSRLQILDDSTRSIGCYVNCLEQRLNELSEIQKDCESLKSQIITLTERQDGSRDRISRVEKQCGDLESDIKALRKSSESMQQQLSIVQEYGDRLSQAEEQCGDLKCDVKALRDGSESMQQQLVIVQKYGDRLSQAEEQCGDLESDVKALRDGSESMQQQLSIVQEYGDRLLQAEEQCGDLQSDVKALRDGSESMQQQLLIFQEYGDRLSQAEEQCDHVESDVKTLRDGSESMQQQLLVVQEAFERQNDEFALLQNQMIKLDSRLIEQQSQVSLLTKFEQQLSEFQCQLSRIRSIESQLSDVTYGLRIVDDRSRSIDAYAYSLGQRLEDLSDLENNFERVAADLSGLGKKSEADQQQQMLVWQKHDERLSRVEKQGNGIVSALRTVRENGQKQMSVIESDVTQLKTKLRESVESGMLEMKKEVTNLNSKLKNMTRIEQRLQKVTDLESEIARLKTQIGELNSAWKSSQQQISVSIESMRSDISEDRKKRSSAIEKQIGDVSEIKTDIGKLKSQCDEIDRELKLSQQHFTKSNESIESMRSVIYAMQNSRIDIERQLSKSSHIEMRSMIVSEFPSIFDEFREKSFVLLWRGS
jgi:chromosome segregation ATPase